MDFSSFEIGGIPLLLLIPGIVESAKNFGITGKRSLGLSLGLGAFFIGLAQAIALSLIPAPALPWITVVVVGIGGALACSGYYDLVKRAGVFCRHKRT